MIDTAHHNQLVDAMFALAPVIPVLTIEHLDDALPLAHALAANGLPVLEITLRTACALEAIALIARELPGACVGGSWMVPADALKARDWQRIGSLARAAAALR